MLRRFELVMNTDEQVREYVVKALALVAELEPPEDLREQVFNAAVNFYAAKQVTAQDTGLAMLPSLDVKGK